MKKTFWVFLICTISWLVTACTNKTDQNHTNPVPVWVQKVNIIKRPKSVSVSGSVYPFSKVNLGFMVSGKIRKINVKEGEHVHVHQFIACLDTTEYHYALQIAEAKKVKADDEFRRLKQMYEKKSLTPDNYTKARETARQADANYNLYLKHLHDTNLNTPISGIVAAKRVDAGDIIKKGLPLFTIVNTDSVKINAAVPESEIDHIRIGQSAKINIAALDTTFTGHVYSIGALADPSSRTYTVKVLVSNPKLLLKVGMIVEAKINTGQISKEITVPASAIVHNPNNQSYCFVIDNKNHRAYEKRVFFSGLSADSTVVIRKGLKPGEQVVTGGQDHLRDGMSVKIVKRSGK